jgi:ADP-heptose:LPS heptosyltransferase
VDLATLPEPHRAGYVALAIGAAHATKRLPPHKLVELAQRIEGPLVMIGGPDEVAVARTIADAVGARAFNAAGKYDLLGSASLIRQARSVVAHDSGAMHVACAFNRPVVCVWGNTVPAFGMGPYQPRSPHQAHSMEVPELDCRPCSKLGFEKCPKGHFHCMEKQDIGRIAALANNDR